MIVVLLQNEKKTENWNKGFDPQYLMQHSIFLFVFYAIVLCQLSASLLYLKLHLKDGDQRDKGTVGYWCPTRNIGYQ